MKTLDARRVLKRPPNAWDHLRRVQVLEACVGRLIPGVRSTPPTDPHRVSMRRAENDAKSVR